MIATTTITTGGFSAHIVTLPAIAHRFCLTTGKPGIEVRPAIAPDLILMLELRMVIELTECWLYILKAMVFDERYEAERLVLLKPDNARPRHLPVHREGERQPISLNEA